MAAYPPTPLSCSPSSLGSWMNVLNASLICSEPAHVFPPCPEKKPQPSPQPTRPRHLPALVTHLTRPSPASPASVLGSQFLVCLYVLDTVRETVLTLTGLLLWGGGESRLTPGPVRVRFQRVVSGSLS